MRKYPVPVVGEVVLKIFAKPTHPVKVINSAHLNSLIKTDNDLTSLQRWKM